MELGIASPNEKEKMQMKQYQAQAAPLAQQEKGMAGQMGDMVKQKLMSDAAGAGAKAITAGAQQGMSSMLAPTVGSAIEGGAVLGPMAGTGGMAALGTAVPYVGAGLLAGKALGLFNEGGVVGPLSPQYAYDGNKAKASLEYQMKMGRQNKKDDEDLVDMIKKGYEFTTFTAPMNARAVGLGDPIAERKYGAGIYGTGEYYQQGGQVGMTQDQAMALMNNQPDPDQLYNEIVAESMTEAAQGQIPPTPTMRPPLMVDPLGADTTYSNEMYKPINT
jgi:hypothetical protein